ncbi:hypothetical protein BD410DRAFT_766664 [Rickenella mellea]|uniref:P/Homo B domain-containing protein n=1 Tax=Rickenella mellea TaxID=50990 RepID=A0A4Y7QCP4_9AGAM|nr:hypothetical protein BD410DRAFT_766664 [Rickenella mellea]
MKLPLGLVALLLIPLTAHAVAPSKRNHSTHDYYVLEHDPHGSASLEEVVDALGLELVEQAWELQNHWILRRPGRHVQAPHSNADDFLDEFNEWRSRTTSTSQDLKPPEKRARLVASSIRNLSRQHLRQRVKRAPPPVRPEPTNQQKNTSAHIVAERLGILDPEFPQQWHLVNEEFPMHMVNATPVWEMGITGEGIIAAMVDDGLDYESEDLAENFDAEGSYDFNDHVPLPKPVLFDDHHGTRCAGQIAAGKNNVCGVGIAYKSKVAGIRILSGPISDIDEASALNYGFQNTSIYSCSWGPPDDGRSMEGPSYLIQKAVVNGILNGRGGKGSIFVFASGNGAASGDQCNFDGYTNSIYSVTVAAIDYKGLHPYYSEACAANMVVTYSSGSGKNIVTTDVGQNKCSHIHGGTSAAAPNAVGVFALALAARPELTWRDIQHLCVRTAQEINPDDPDWETTAAGRRFSYKYGFGSLNAYEYVKAAQAWTLVTPQTWIEMPAIQISNGTMDLNRTMTGGDPIVPGGVHSSMTVTKDMLEQNNFAKLEHVNVRVWISHTQRGDVEVEITSPKGIRSVLAGRRKYDRDQGGFPGWRFMSVKHWDEDPIGEWSIRVSDQSSEDHSGRFLGWSMTLWGSSIDAKQVKTFVLKDPDTPFPLPPPVPEQPDTGSAPPSASTTKSHSKPTAHLPGDHGDAEGEADKPAFSGASPPSSGPTATLTPTADEGWFPSMANLVASQKWVFGAIGAVVIFGISAGIFFYWRRRPGFLRKGKYTSLMTDDVAMGSIDQEQRSSLGGGTRTKELYDAFGELSDDEDANEETGLHSQRNDTRNTGFHSGFLEDDDATPLEPHYKDEPELDHSRADRPPDDGTRSPGSGSGDGSWVHASEGR